MQIKLTLHRYCVPVGRYIVLIGRRGDRKLGEGGIETQRKTERLGGELKGLGVEAWAHSDLAQGLF